MHPAFATSRFLLIIFFGSLLSTKISQAESWSGAIDGLVSSGNAFGLDVGVATKL